jgi:hypothetical protein
VRRYGQESRCATATTRMTEPTTTPTEKRSRPSKTRKRHGLRGLMARVSAQGLSAIDQRSAGYRALVGWRSQLERDLGGSEHISAQQQALVENACRMRLYLDHVDGWLMSQATLISKRTLLPIFRERMDLAAKLERTLAALGLHRQEPPAPSIADFAEHVKPHPVDGSEAG